MKVLAPRLRLVLRTAVLLALLATFAPSAHALSGGYAVHAWAGCPSGFNSGSWDDAGRVYVPCGSPSTIGVYDTSARLVETIRVDRFVTDVAPTRDGRFLYLASPSGPARMSRNALGVWAVDAWRPQPYSLYGIDYQLGGYFVATDGAGNAYYADGAWAPNTTHTIVKYAADGRVVTRFGEWSEGWDLGSFYWALGGLAVSTDGSTVYTTELGNNRIQEWRRQADGVSYAPRRSIGATMDSQRAGACDSERWIGTFAAAYDVALDRAGNVYVINTSCKQVLKFSAGFASLLANVSVKIGDGDYPRPHGFAVGSDGTVYVGENQRVLRPNGGTLPANGMPPVQPAGRDANMSAILAGAAPAPSEPAPAPAPAPTAPADTTATSVAPAPAEPVAAAPAPVASTTSVRMRVSVARRVRLIRRSGRTYAVLIAMCTQRCRVETMGLRGERVVGLRISTLAANRTTAILLPVRRINNRAGIVRIELSARDRIGRTTNVVRSVRY